MVICVNGAGWRPPRLGGARYLPRIEIACRDGETRTLDLSVPNRTFYQLNYIPISDTGPTALYPEI